jgi:hypothetical protein
MQLINRIKWFLFRNETGQSFRNMRKGLSTCSYCGHTEPISTGYATNPEDGSGILISNVDAINNHIKTKHAKAAG